MTGGGERILEDLVESRTATQQHRAAVPECSVLAYTIKTPTQSPHSPSAKALLVFTFAFLVFTETTPGCLLSCPGSAKPADVPARWLNRVGSAGDSSEMHSRGVEAASPALQQLTQQQHQLH